MTGIEEYRTKEDFKVLKVHYTADPDKRSENVIAELEKGYPGGRAGAAWRKEMEIDFTAYSGQLFIHDIIQAHKSKIIVDRKVETHWLKFGSLDWGRRNAASYHVYTVDENKDIYSAEEIYLNNISIPGFSELIKATEYYKQLHYIVADPSLFSKNQEMEAGAESIADKFRAQGITLIPAPSRKDEPAINELLDRWDHLETKRARFTINPRNTKQIWEFEHLRYKELTTALLENRNPHEVLVDKDNHSWDDFKYFILSYLYPAQMQELIKIHKGSVAWFLEQDEIAEKDWRKHYA